MPAYTEVPCAPTRPTHRQSAGKAPFPYSPAKAVALLTAHGWKVVPNGTTTCAKPGTGAGECGAGIPAGTPISFVWANHARVGPDDRRARVRGVSSEAKQAAGINITLQTKSFNFLTANYNDQNPAAAKYTNDWGVNNYGGLFDDYYPTAEGVWNAGGGLQPRRLQRPEANTLMNDSVHSGNPERDQDRGVLPGDAPAGVLHAGPGLPARGQHHKVAGPPDGLDLSMTQQQLFPQYWY